MIFKKVEITRQNSVDVTILENVNLWFASGCFNGKITLYINELVFTNLKLHRAFWIPDNMIDFETIEEIGVKCDVFKIKAYL